MQNSVSDGEIVEQHQTTNNDIPAGSYDEVFPALSTPAAAPAPQKAWSNTNSKLRVGSTTVTQHFVIPCTERKMDNSEKFGESDSMRACTQIMALTNTKIEIAAGRDQALTFLVTGKAPDVLEAQKRIIANFQQPSETKVEIPKEYHRKLLGKGGQKLRDLEKLTACRISVPNISDASNTITISGPRAGVDKALHEIRVTYDELSKQGFERVTVPKIYHPFINGPNGNTVQKWQSELSVRINVPPPSVSNDEITIAGTKEGVLAVKDAILAIYQEMATKCKQVSVEVPKAQHKYVIGPKGQFINEVLEQTGVAVEMPSADVDTDTITLRGPQEKLGRALTMVCEKSTSSKTIELDAPAWLHKRLKGPKGANIQRITEDHPEIYIRFNQDKDSIKIEGPAEEVTRVENEFRKEINELRGSLVRDVLTVDPKFFKHIIGKQGCNVNRLKDEYSVEISVADEGSTSTITLEGSPDGVVKAKADLEELIDKLVNEKELTVNVDVKLIVRMNRMREIRDQFPNLNIQLPAQGEKAVKIRGRGEEADKCVVALRNLARQLAQEFTLIEVPIFKRFHRNIIGKNGINIRKIRDETGTTIDLPNENDESENIQICGKPADVQKAKEMIEKIQNDQANIATEEISIDPKHHPTLIGSGGRIINSIREECGHVQIKFPDSASNSDRVILRGPKEDVQKAIQQLLTTTKELEQASFEDRVTAKPHLHKFLIGKNGSTISRIRQKTGARVMFPSENDANPDTIVIMGKKEAVANAKVELEQLIADIMNTVEDEISVDPSWHRHFVKNRADIIQKITDYCGGSGTITISFPRPGSTPADKVTLKGPKEAIALAKQRILDTVKELESQVKIDCIIPKKYHRTVMGKGGDKVKLVQSDHNVAIKFPDREEPGTGDPEINGDSEGSEVPLPGDIITIAGQPDDCERAKRALLDYVPITIKVAVPHEIHRSIIGTKGEGVRRLMNDCDVRIDVPPSEAQLEEITVSGAPTAVEEAKKRLLEKVEEFEKDKEDRALRSFKVTVEIDPDYHPKIIGRKGAVITKIRSDFHVNVNLPQRGAEDEHIITITGYENDANAAREHILSIVNEFKDRVKEEVEIDARVHARLIGQRGRTIRRLMDEFKVDIKFPRSTDPNPDLVVITGNTEEAVLDAKEELTSQAEKLMDDLNDSYAPPPRQPVLNAEDENGGPVEGFRVTGAPWSQNAPNTESITDFPSFGLGGEQNSRGPAAWGPRR